MRPTLLPALLAIVMAPGAARADDGSIREPGSAGNTVTFPYRQRQLLYSRDSAGGLAYVPRGAPADAPLPLVVFLHGMNPSGVVHMWFGPPYGDLRGVVDELVSTKKTAPFVLAAPTHTRYATGATVMWHDFDLADFVDATARALGARARIDRERVIVVGHSGGGCNPSGGIFAGRGEGARPVAVLAVDTCVDDRTVPAMARLSRETRVLFYWQKTWPRPTADLARGCPQCEIHEVADLGATGHVRILPEALRQSLPAILAPR